MPVKVNSDGTWSAEYEGPYLGLDVQHPETLISDKASPAFNNFMLRNAELRSRPTFIQKYPLTLALGVSSQGVESFIDANGIWHTVTWMSNQLFQFQPPSSFVGLPGTNPSGNQPMAYRVFANKLYYTNIATFLGAPNPFVGIWDGLAAGPTTTQTFADASVANSAIGISKTDSPTVGGSLPGAPTVVGPLALGANFIAELNNQIILANVSILDQGTGGSPVFSFPNVMWWSANGLPTQFDPTQNVSAGFNALLDVSDQITGLLTLGVAGYLFRTEGITQFAPTGSSVIPWEFDHMWASDNGIGNVLPWSIAQYGPTGAFIAEDNIYTLSLTTSQPIGGSSRDAIFADIANASGTPFANIIPKFKAGYVYLTYQLGLVLIGPGNIPFVRFWIYSFEEQNWSSWDTNQVNLSARMNWV